MGMRHDIFILFKPFSYLDNPTKSMICFFEFTGNWNTYYELKQSTAQVIKATTSFSHNSWDSLGIVIQWKILPYFAHIPKFDQRHLPDSWEWLHCKGQGEGI